MSSRGFQCSKPRWRGKREFSSVILANSSNLFVTVNPSVKWEWYLLCLFHGITMRSIEIIQVKPRNFEKFKIWYMWQSQKVKVWLVVGGQGQWMFITVAILLPIITSCSRPEPQPIFLSLKSQFKVNTPTSEAKGLRVQPRRQMWDCGGERIVPRMLMSWRHSAVSSFYHMEERRGGKRMSKISKQNSSLWLAFTLDYKEWHRHWCATIR